MKRITIRPITVHDLPGLHNLFKSRDNFESNSAEKRLLMLKWIAFENPFANQEPTYFIAEVDGQIVGHLGRMPAEFIIKRNIRRGYFVHDLYVHPDYRSGHGFFIVNSLYRAVEHHSDSFICMVWTTDLNLEFQKRRGYLYRMCFRYYKFFNPSIKIKKIIKFKIPSNIISFLVRPIFSVMDILAPSYHPIKGCVYQLKRFDSRFDDFNDRIRSKIGLCVNKTSAYLNWRYVDKPFSRMSIIATEVDGRISGYAVLNLGSVTDPLEGTLVDIMADPNDEYTVSILLQEAVKFFKKAKMYSIRCCMSDFRFVKALKRHFFFKDPLKNEPVMLANLERSQHKEMLADLINWHLTYGASDELMLE